MHINIYHTEMNPESGMPVLIKEKGIYHEFDNCRTPESVVALMNDIYRLGFRTEEHMYLIAMNNACKILGIFKISQGTVDQTICEPRDILMKTLLCNASGIIIIHNHPGGDTTPSMNDMKVYKRLQAACDLIGIQFFDNIIISEDEYLSFEQEKLLENSD